MRRTKVSTHKFTHEFELVCDNCGRVSSSKDMIQVGLIDDTNGQYKNCIVCSELCSMMMELRWIT